MNSLQNKIEEYKKLQIAKDNEIAKLNDINSSKQNEIERLKNIIEEQKNGTREKLLEEEIKSEKEKLNSKINDLELKIYNLNDQKNILVNENKNLKEQIEALNQKEEIHKEKTETVIENNNKENIDENTNKENIEDNNEKEKIDENTNKENNINENNIQEEVKLEDKELEKIKKEKEELDIKYEQILKEKSSIEEEKARIMENYNNLKDENDRIKQEQKNLEEEYSKLKIEHDKLKDEFNNNEIKLKAYIAQENLNNQNNNDDELYLTKLTELDELKLKLSKYESGELIADIIKEKMNQEKSDFNMKEKNYLEKIKEKDKKISEYISKIKQNESRIKLLSEKILGINQEKGELENIVIKQESRVGKLGVKVDKIESLLKNKNDEIRENENYSLKLINIIKEQKSLINTLKNEQKAMEENYSSNIENINTINSLKAQITALKRKLDVKEDSFLTLQKSHKILQEKYLKTCSNNRKKEQELLLKQAKRLKADKIQREKDMFLEKNKKLFDFNKELVEINYSSLNNFKPKKSPSSAYKNNKEVNTINVEEKVVKDDNKSEKSHIQQGPVLPIIRSSKNKERIEKMKIKNVDDGKLEEISDMMNNILNEL